jgi:hypothetical protein
LYFLIGKFSEAAKQTGKIAYYGNPNNNKKNPRGSKLEMFGWDGRYCHFAP